MKLPKCKYPDTEMDLATLKEGTDVGIEDHGIFFLNANFDYGGAGQGLGYCIDEEFIRKFLAAFGAGWIRECEGQIFVEHSHCKIYRLIPLETREGKEFDIEEWSRNLKKKEVK